MLSFPSNVDRISLCCAFAAMHCFVSAIAWFILFITSLCGLGGVHVRELAITVAN